MADREGQSRETNVDGEQRRSQEEESKLDRLRYAGQERGQCHGEEERSRFFFLLRTGAGVHGKRGAGKSAHHERIFADQESGGVNGKLGGFRRSQLREENILRAFHERSVDHH